VNRGGRQYYDNLVPKQGLKWYKAVINSKVCGKPIDIFPFIWHAWQYCNVSINYCVLFILRVGSSVQFYGGKNTLQVFQIAGILDQEPAPVFDNLPATRFTDNSTA